MDKIYDVIVPVALNQAFSYKSEDELHPGDLVQVSFGRQKVIGLVADETTSSYPKLKSISKAYNINIGEENLKLIKWMANYTLAPIGLIFKSFITSSNLDKESKSINKYSLADDWEEKFKAITKTKSRVQVIELLEQQSKITSQTIMDSLLCGDSVIKGLLKAEVIKKEEEEIKINFPKPDLTLSGKELSNDQKEATSKLLNNVEKEFCVSLLDGITGSGKTEVYFEAIAEILSKGKQVLIMLPEISLSGGFIERFQHRFGIKPYVWHSSVSPAQKNKTWQGVISGEVKVIVGARSSLLLPYKDLGLIIVDEEHDNSYKQEDNFIYNARDMAVVRANIGSFPCILVSATPSLETVYNCEQGKYEHIELKTRYGKAKLPDIKLVDMRNEDTATQEFLSPTLKNAIKENFDSQEQTLLFLNRRGYAPLIICKSCGERLACPYCTSWLTVHKKFNKLMCHHCGFEKNMPEKCPSCEERDSFTSCGPGVEKITEEVKSLIPGARVITVSSDLSANNLQETIRDIELHRYDIIVGTQMISKGHNFPKLTLVGIVDGDIASADLRAGEKSFQLIQQVSGRAGRADLPGKVLIQTYESDSMLMQALENNDKEAFIEEEKELRADRNLPPYGKLASVIVSCVDESLLTQSCKKLAANIPMTEGVMILGPAEAPLYRLRGKYRKRFLIKIDKNKSGQKLIQHWINSTGLEELWTVFVF